MESEWGFRELVSSCENFIHSWVINRRRHQFIGWYAYIVSWFKEGPFLYRCNHESTLAQSFEQMKGAIVILRERERERERERVRDRVKRIMIKIKFWSNLFVKEREYLRVVCDLEKRKPGGHSGINMTKSALSPESLVSKGSIHRKNPRDVYSSIWDELKAHSMYYNWQTVGILWLVFVA